MAVTPTLSTPHQNPAYEFERYKALLQYDVSALREEYKQRNEHHRTMHRSIVDFASGAIKIILLINGGAAIAILAFLGNEAAKNGSAADTLAAVRALAPALNSFVVGVFAAGFTAGFAYLSQVIFLELPERWRPQTYGNVLRAIAVAAATASLFAFAVGSWSARDGLTSLGASPPGATSSGKF